MTNLSLHQLIESIAGAVAEAQDKIQRFQISTVSRYFDADNRPVSVDVRLPSLSLDAEQGDERLVRVPLLSLVGSRLLSIKDMEISFEVGLGNPDGKAEAKSPASADPVRNGTPGWPSEPHQPLGVDLSARRNGATGGTARVTLRVESQPPSDGMARLIQQLDKLI
ncbi:DUF2589 domain-containing protein [Phaeospirillum tilakii]|uniref:DUF2589 domain-containing protein n=1 Tax=Phaeospirillum tilakii TaxID=741673 RepID=A0ABW5C9Y7_9PROT